MATHCLQAFFCDHFGAWVDANESEMYSLLGLLIYTGICRLPTVEDYWKTSAPFSGNWARAMIPCRRRFMALMTFLPVMDHTTEKVGDRLRKVHFLVEHIQTACQTFFQLGQNISIDERMIKSKGRVILKQHMPKKNNNKIRNKTLLFATQRLLTTGTLTFTQAKLYKDSKNMGLHRLLS